MKLLVFCPNWVGDAVMATPALRALRRGFAAARIVGLMRPVIADTLAGLSCFDGVRVWNPRGADRSARTWPVLKTLRREQYDIAVLLTNSFHTAAIARLAGATRRVGYRRDGRGWLLTDKLEPLRTGRRFTPMPAIDYYLQLAYYLGCQHESYQMDLATSDADERAADGMWRALGLHHAERVILFNPGGAFGPAKCWPTAHFADLARRLTKQSGTQVLVLCGPAERPLAREIVKRADRPDVHGLADFDVSIGLSKACVRRADLLVTTDSGPRHFAAAFDTPVVTLFGPTHVEWSETYFAKAIHLQHKVPCGPCQLRECPLDHACMRDLGPRHVFDYCMQTLERHPRDVRPLRRTA